VLWSTLGGTRCERRQFISIDDPLNEANTAIATANPDTQRGYLEALKNALNNANNNLNFLQTLPPPDGLKGSL
jgi:hypothetical protein